MDPVRKIRKELYAPGGPDGIWWLGNAGFAIRLDSHYIFLDPCVTEWPEAPYASSGKLVGTTKVRLHEFPLEADEFDRADLVLYTHDHSDHLDRGLLPRLMELKSEIWAPEQCVQSILEEGVPREQAHLARVGGSLRKDNYLVEFIRARHASVGGSCDLDLKWYYLDFALAHKIQNDKHQGTAMGPARRRQGPPQKEVTPRVRRENGRGSESPGSPSTTQSFDDTGRKARAKNSLHYQFGFCASSAQKPGITLHHSGVAAIPASTWPCW